jgi:diguanylate cyclase (GGDEF)-like protein
VNILIVDDDIVDRESIKRTLNQSTTHFNFAETESVDEALTTLSDKKFDAILLDYRMPKRDGIELLLELKNASMDVSVAVIMLSNSEETELALECVRAGAQDFLLKSEVTTSRLQRAIVQAQARFELEQKLHVSYQQAKKLAEHDTLTGLYNRYSFEEALQLSILQKSREDTKLALTLFDLDNFKFINDSYGHHVGDDILRQVAQRVNDCLRGNEVFARLGGDEFAIILSNLQAIDNATRVTKRILSTLDKPFDIAGISIKVTASIGIAIYPDSTVNATELLKHADIAMYRSKKLGRNQICYFEDKMQEQFLQRYQIEANLIGAVERNEFILHYQPVFETTTSTIVGFEALIRWNFQNKLLYPDNFITIAECSRAIVDIGRWVIDQAIYQLSIWNLRDNKAYSIAINLSSVQLSDKTLFQFINRTLDKYHVNAELIEFELTETALLENSDQAIDTLELINNLGCRIALDDFGSGFSSVSHLQSFPIDTVKIDKSLIMESEQPKTRALIEGLSAMLHSLSLDIVAEGIENKKSLQFCQQLNIRRVQGYYFSKPFDARTIEKMYL